MFDFMKDAVLWISGQTGLTESVVGYVGTIIVVPILGWITKALDWAELERKTYVFFYGISQKANDLIVGVPGLGYAWEKWLEPYFIKQVAGLFRVIAQIPMAIAAGFNSRNESLVSK